MRVSVLDGWQEVNDKEIGRNQMILTIKSHLYKRNKYRMF